MTKITGTNTYIDVEIDERLVRIPGELVVGGFICYKDSIKEWVIPFEQKQKVSTHRGGYFFCEKDCSPLSPRHKRSLRLG